MNRYDSHFILKLCCVVATILHKHITSKQIHVLDILKSGVIDSVTRYLTHKKETNDEIEIGFDTCEREGFCVCQRALQLRKPGEI